MIEISVQISPDNTSVTLYLSRFPDVSNPEQSLRADLSDLLQKIQNVLDSEGIVHGIRQDALRQSYAEIEKGGFKVECIVAKATPPKKEIPSHLLFSPKIRVLSPIFTTLERQSSSTENNIPILQAIAPQESQGGLGKETVDFREIRSYLVVNTDELIAIRKETVPGVFGTDVTGQMIPYGQVEIKQPEPTSGVYEKENRVYAEISGKFSYDENKFWIDTKIVISGDLDFHYGNIRFPGDLEIKGEVRDRFKIWLGGNLVAHHTLDVYQIMVGGSVQVAEGIIGRGKGLLRSKGSVMARYVENCNVECLGPIKIARSVFTSNLMCRGEVLIPKGRLIGGMTKALNLVDVAELGNKMGILTEVILGLDFVIERQLQECTDRQQKIVLERKALVTSLNAHSITKTLFEEKVNRLAVEEEMLRESMVNKLPLLDVNDSAVLRVRGKVHPGVYIRIGSLKLVIDKPLSAVEFYIDKSGGLIRSRKIEAKSS